MSPAVAECPAVGKQKKAWPQAAESNRGLEWPVETSLNVVCSCWGANQYGYGCFSLVNLIDQIGWACYRFLKSLCWLVILCSCGDAST